MFPCGLICLAPVHRNTRLHALVAAFWPILMLLLMHNSYALDVVVEFFLSFDPSLAPFLSRGDATLALGLLICPQYIVFLLLHPDILRNYRWRWSYAAAIASIVAAFISLANVVRITARVFGFPGVPVPLWLWSIIVPPVALPLLAILTTKGYYGRGETTLIASSVIASVLLDLFLPKISGPLATPVFFSAFIAYAFTPFVLAGASLAAPGKEPCNP